MARESKFSQVTIGPRKSSEYGTPLDFFKKLNRIFKFAFDPCAFPGNRLGMEYYCTKDTNGLGPDWDWNTFINPPFGTKKGEDIRAWIQKMQKESNTYPSVFYVMLLPARIESNWFQELIFNDPYGLIYAVRGRLKFYNPETNKNNDPHPIGSILYIKGYDITIDMVVELANTIPGLFLRGERFDKKV